MKRVLRAQKCSIEKNYERVNAYEKLFFSLYPFSTENIFQKNKFIPGSRE